MEEASSLTIEDAVRAALRKEIGSDAVSIVEIARDIDISAGITGTLKAYQRWTLYLKTKAAIDITIELSPDNGITWFEIPESPIKFDVAKDDVFEIGYDATDIKLTGSNTTLVTAIALGVY